MFFDCLCHGIDLLADCLLQVHAMLSEKFNIGLGIVVVLTAWRGVS